MGLANNAAKHILAELKSDHVCHNAPFSRESKGRNESIPRAAGCDWSQEVLQLIASDKYENGYLPLPAPRANGSAGMVPAEKSQNDGCSFEVIQNIVDAVDTLDTTQGPVGKNHRKRALPVQESIDRIVGDFNPSDVAAGSKNVAQSRVTGWTLHLARTWKSVCRLAGETKKDWQKRVQVQAKQTWHDACKQ